MPSVPRQSHFGRARGALALLCAAVLIALPVLARAQSAESDLAEKAFLEGKKAVSEHRLSEACAKFAESQRLDPQAGTLLYVATCHDEQGKTATAWAEYMEAEALAQRTGKSERVREARARIAAIESKLSRVQTQVEGAPPNLVVRANGREIRDLGAALPFDPGPLTIEVSAPGRMPWVKTIEVPPGPGKQVVLVPVLAPLLPPAAPPPPVDVARSARLATERRARAIAAGTVGGVGVVGLVVGGVFGALASQQFANAKKAGGCGDTTCTSYAAFKPGYSDALRSAYVSTGGFVVGGALAATGIILFVTIPSARNQVRVGAGPGSRLDVGGTF